MFSRNGMGETCQHRKEEVYKGANLKDEAWQFSLATTHLLSGPSVIGSGLFLKQLLSGTSQAPHARYSV